MEKNKKTNTEKVETTKGEGYVKLSLREHILHRPDSYIGSTISEEKEVYIVKSNIDNVENFKNIKIGKETINYNAGFIKLFDEIITNASDHSIRTNKVKTIKVFVDNKTICVENDGPGIPIKIHEEEKIYIPELIFGNFLTGQNFKDDEKRMVGGRNGYGAKLTNCFSKEFILETGDGKKKYVQRYADNLSIIEKPNISRSSRNYTKITYTPDFKRFGMGKTIPVDIKRSLFKRVVDVATYCSNLRVYWNGKLIPIKNFKNYMEMYNDGSSKDIIYEQLNDYWEIGVLRSTNDEFEQASLVNGISTLEGGTHVNYITNQISKGLDDFLTKKHKGIKVNKNDIKRNLFVFVNCKIPNPSFSSQTKEVLTTKLINEHTGGVHVSQKIIKTLSNSDIIERILRYIEAKEASELAKSTKKKSSKVKINKLDDAIKAGTDESQQCKLFLTEGDSAKTSAITGFSQTGRQHFGAFALKGKPLNVRDASTSKIRDNAEIMHIIEALGLKIGKRYSDTSELRYGKVVIMSDQDLDGFHIKGLLINLIDFFWPELLEMDFLYEFITPIVRIKKGKKKDYFYRLEDFNNWKNTNKETGWTSKYYKGLGTIEKDECKEFFKDIDKHLIRFNYRNDKETKDLIELAFRKNRSDDRKKWLGEYNPTNVMDKFTQRTYIDSFINEELIEFSLYDNIRSIPNIVDGLKPSQRKILYTLFKRNFKNNTKVIQLCGSVLETAAYHHGDASLQKGIVKMAQDFVGSNNINLLEPFGQFGSRLKGGEDSAAGRYLETKLSKISNKIFKKEDEFLLKYLEDDNEQIEPDFFIPIVPLLLINGSTGVGTAYSTSIPAFNPRDIIDYIINKLKKKEETVKLTPYYRGFDGEVSWSCKSGRYETRGNYKVTGANTIIVTELPIGVWTDSYIEHLEKLCDKKVLKDYENNSTDEKVNIKLIFKREQLKSLLKNPKINKILKMESYLSLNNMVAFDENMKLVKYENQYDIINKFIKLRYKYYTKRKDNHILRLAEDRRILVNKMKFVKGIMDDKIILKNKKKSEIIKMIEALKISSVSDSYDYLFNMSFSSLTNEKLIDFKNSYTQKKIELETLKNTKVSDIWIEELNDLKKIL